MYWIKIYCSSLCPYVLESQLLLLHFLLNRVPFFLNTVMGGHHVIDMKLYPMRRLHCSGLLCSVCCSCLPIFWDTSIHWIITQKSEDLIYTAVEAWNLTTLQFNSSQCNPLQCWQKCCWRFIFPALVFPFLHLHLFVLRHIRFNHCMHCSEVCVSHVEQDGYHRIRILEMIHPLFLKCCTLFQLIRDILGYAMVCSIFTIIGLI